MIYFASAILPLILDRYPKVCLKIVGNAAPEEIRQLASERVEVLGFVPDLGPVLREQ